MPVERITLENIRMRAREGALLSDARDVTFRDVHLEVCPTSNVHTGAAASVASHPITALWRAGVSLSFHTDNRLMSRITHSGEALALLQQARLAPADLVGMGLEAARHSFLAAPIRNAAQGQLRRWAAGAGLPLPSGPLPPPTRAPR